MSARLPLDGTLTHDQVVEIVRLYVEDHHPTSCTSCGRGFDSAGAYLRGTKQLGSPVSCDADLRDWRPKLPIGTLSYSNCGCGSTLTVGTSSLPLRTMWAMLAWLARSSRERNVTAYELLDGIRHDVDDALIGEAATAWREGR